MKREFRGGRVRLMGRESRLPGRTHHHHDPLTALLSYIKAEPTWITWYYWPEFLMSSVVDWLISNGWLVAAGHRGCHTGSWSSHISDSHGGHSLSWAGAAARPSRDIDPFQSCHLNISWSPDLLELPIFFSLSYGCTAQRASLNLCHQSGTTLMSGWNQTADGFVDLAFKSCYLSRRGQFS